MHARERKYAFHDNNRHVRPFEWGTEFLDGEARDRAEDPRALLRTHTERVMRESADFFALPPVTDYVFKDNCLTWTSALTTPTPENNTVRAQFFPAPPGKHDDRRRAVIVLPQWNADAASHVSLCRLLARLGVATLRLTLPYHEGRRPRSMERAEHLVSANIGRTIQSVRQAVLDARGAAGWLKEHGYEQIGILGTSIGSCVAFLAFAHDAHIGVGVFNHVSSYFADVVWRGLSTRHVRAGFGDELTLDELRKYWLPISPYPYAEQLLDLRPERPMRFISARYDLTFLPELSRQVIAEVKRLGLPLDVAWLRCGHYTLGEAPWKFIDGWKIATFFRRHL
jgi:hypothetical protein